MRMRTLLFMGFVAALCVHVALGHGIDLILEDIKRGVAVILLVSIGYFLYMGLWMLFFANKEMYDRNRQATLLANRYNRGMLLSEAEQAEVKRLVSVGVLEYRGLVYTLERPKRCFSPLYLTDRAIDALWH